MTAAAGTARYVGGVAVGGEQPWNTDRQHDFAALRAARVTWIRTDLSWQYLQPSPDTWRWELFDPVVADAAAAGLQVLAVLHTVPGWANHHSGVYGPPDQADQTKAYCYRTAQRYLPRGVTTYEIGNEVNLPHPGWVPDGTQYVRTLLFPCAAGIRDAERGTPVTILLGALAPTEWTGGTDPVTFLAAAYTTGAGRLVDAVSWHPYTGTVPPAASPHLTVDPDRLHHVMAAHGDAVKKIWATEYGLPTGGPGSVSEQTQAASVPQALVPWYARRYAGPLFWYSARDTGTSPDDREQHFGLLRYNGTPKPAYAALRARLTR